MSLETVKLPLVYMDKFVAIVLMSLMTKINRSFQILKSLKRDVKATKVVIFFKCNPLSLKKCKII